MKNEKSYMYPATEENLKTFKDHPRKIVSDDQKYILVYSEDHLNEVLEYYDWLNERDRLGMFNESDHEYDDLLSDLGIKKSFNWDAFKIINYVVDNQQEVVITFHNSNQVMQDMVCIKKDLISGKSEAKFLQAYVSVKDYGKSVKDAKVTGYFAFTKAGK